MPVTIRVLRAADGEETRSLRLRGITEHPEAFGASVEEDAALTVEDWARRLEEGLPDSPTFGAFDASGVLVGMVKVIRHHRVKTRHRMYINAMYVSGDMQGQGIGRALMDAALNHIRALTGVEQVVLAVTSGNLAGRRLYRRCGFITWGVDPRHIRVGDVDYDIEWMVLEL